jgi:hypothetical protein
MRTSEDPRCYGKKEGGQKNYETKPLSAFFFNPTSEDERGPAIFIVCPFGKSPAEGPARQNLIAVRFLPRLT